MEKNMYRSWLRGSVIIGILWIIFNVINNNTNIGMSNHELPWLNYQFQLPYYFAAFAWIIFYLLLTATLFLANYQAPIRKILLLMFYAVSAVLLKLYIDKFNNPEVPPILLIIIGVNSLISISLIKERWLNILALNMALPATLLLLINFDQHNIVNIVTITFLWSLVCCLIPNLLIKSIIFFNLDWSKFWLNTGALICSSIPNFIIGKKITDIKIDHKKWIDQEVLTRDQNKALLQMK